ncbi:keratin-associated protein 11-1 [Molossus molossus]|uniref:Keratin-associated protein n=1 Tax=Molossus molossus TaxID=27622 RepID=A0A7J8HZM5_MOLMO|nr:keratin-associated protein 11-1 [Molossus molossus]KAF6477803.1 keratin associated protein 11-1 [Molossus molossus]
MSFLHSARTGASRPMSGACSVPGVPVATGTPHDVECLSGICLPSSFQTGSWLLDHCGQETSCELPVCQPASRVPSPGQGACSRHTARVPSPCSAACSRPVTFVSSRKALGGSSACPPGSPRTTKRPCVSGCRRPC